jgi:hypothetical protein
MVARVSSAPSPLHWVTEPLRSSWIGDPLVLDTAFQLAIRWCYDELGIVSLPTYWASYRQYRKKFPADGIQAIFETTAVYDHKITANITFIDRDKTVIARLNGYEATMYESLAKAFKPQNAA